MKYIVVYVSIAYMLTSLLFITPSLASNPVPLRLSTNGTKLVDPAGKVIRLEGANVDSLADIDGNNGIRTSEILRDASIIKNQLHMNFVRLLVNYASPSIDANGAFTDTYKAELAAWVGALTVG